MDAPTTPVKEVVEYVKEELAVEGVEVKGWGPRSVTLKLPYELPELNEVIDVIMARSGGEVTFANTDNGGVLIVTPDPAHKMQEETPPRRACGVGAFLLLLGALAAAAALVLLLASAPIETNWTGTK